MRVIKGLNSRYTLLDLITGTEKDYHVSDMKPFVLDSALVDPLDIARRDQMELFMENISDHRGKLSHRKLSLGGREGATQQLKRIFGYEIHFKHDLPHGMESINQKIQLKS